MPDWPADKPERRALSSLRPFPRNARQHSDAQVAQVAASITEWGWTNAVLVDESGEIIAGHARVLAANRLGLSEIPVIVARGWSEAQKRAYVIADNKLAENASWDDALLGLELKDLQGIGFDLGLTGFATGEIDELFAKVELKAGRTDPDQAPGLEAEAFTAPGDVWLCGRHRIVCGDCTEALAVERALAGAKPLLMVTDPPYGVNYDPAWRLRAGLDKPHHKLAYDAVNNDQRADWREAWALFPGDVAYIWHGGLHSSVVEASLLAAGFAIRSQIIWAKDALVIGRGHYHWQHEPCWYAVRAGKTGHWAGDRKQSTVWHIPNVHRTQGDVDDGRTSHSTQKPVEAMLRPMLNNSRAGQVVYEPFLGSGTTVIAAEMSGRRCDAVEVNPAYVDVAVRRWQDFTGERARREGDGMLFPAVPAGSAGDQSGRPADETRSEARSNGAA
jgi:DNA modification methylase